MNDIVSKVLHSVWGVWRFRWTALLVTWVVATVGWVVVHELEHKYSATARIYVDTNQILEPLLSGLAIQPNVKQRVALMSKTLLTRPNLEQVVQTTSLHEQIDTTRALENLLKSLENEIAIFDASGAQSLYTIGYTNKDPDIALEVVKALIDIFVATNLGEEYEDNQAAQSFLDARIAEYEAQLTAAEKRLSDFKRENVRSMPGESGGYYQRMQQAESQLRTASLALRELQNRRAELQRQLDSEQPAVVSLDPSWVPPAEARLRSLQNQLDDLLVRYTDRHPQVAQLRETIADLEAVETGEDGSTGVVAQRSESIPSVVRQQVRSMIAETDARIAELKVREAQYQAEYDELKNTVDTIPQVEAELAQLDRDYATISGQHATLLARRESARLTEAVKVNSDDVKFRVVDPPFVPSKPGVPNKQVLNVAALGAGLGAGAGLSFLLALLMPVFYDRRGLASVSDFPILGSVTLHRSLSARLRSWLGTGIFFTLLLLLLITLAGLLYMEINGISSAQLLQKYDFPMLNLVLESDAFQWVADSTLVHKLTSVLERTP